MAVRREHKPSDLDKRLKILNQQLYGKRVPLAISSESSNKKPELKTQAVFDNSKPTILNHQNLNDLVYLKHDLLKISLMAGLAFAVQIGLYLGMINKLIRFPF